MNLPKDELEQALRNMDRAMTSTPDLNFPEAIFKVPLKDFFDFLKAREDRIAVEAFKQGLAYSHKLYTDRHIEQKFTRMRQAGVPYGSNEGGRITSTEKFAEDSWKKFVEEAIGRFILQKKEAV